MECIQLKQNRNVLRFVIFHRNQVFYRLISVFHMEQFPIADSLCFFVVQKDLMWFCVVRNRYEIQAFEKYR